MTTVRFKNYHKHLWLPVLLAFRFMAGHKEKNVASMIKICVSSILLSVYALTMVAAIMNGFEKATHKKLQGIHADVLIRARASSFDEQQRGQRAYLDAGKLIDVLLKEFAHSITAASPSSMLQLMVQHEHKGVQTQHVVALKAIDPDREDKVTAIQSMIVESCSPSHKLPEVLQKDSIILGKTLANQLQVTVGSHIHLLVPDEETHQTKKKNTIALTSKTVAIAGIFKTGIEEFDQHVIYSSLDLLNTITDQGITEVAVKLTDTACEEQLIVGLKQRLSLEVYSWKDLYPALVSALTLEKYVMFIILTLMTLVASLNIISLLLMFISQKQGQIALLKAMGMPNRAIMCLFLFLGAFIILIASSVGIALGALTCVLLERYPIMLPDAYYFTHVPTSMDWPTVGAVLMVMLLFSLLIAWLPARSTKDITIAQVLKAAH